MLIEQIELLPRLYQRIVVPAAVLQELSHPEAPAAVRSWVAKAPKWLEVCDVPDPDQTLGELGSGERDAISLAMAMSADALLIDERAGRREAIRRGLRVVGTLAVLDEAARLALIDFAAVLERLRETSFHLPEALVRRFLRPSTSPGIAGTKHARVAMNRRDAEAQRNSRDDRASAPPRLCGFSPRHREVGDNFRLQP